MFFFADNVELRSIKKWQHIETLVGYDLGNSGLCSDSGRSAPEAVPRICFWTCTSEASTESSRL